MGNPFSATLPDIAIVALALVASAPVMAQGPAVGMAEIVPAAAQLSGPDLLVEVMALGPVGAGPAVPVPPRVEAVLTAADGTQRPLLLHRVDRENAPAPAVGAGQYWRGWYRAAYPAEAGPGTLLRLSVPGQGPGAVALLLPEGPAVSDEALASVPVSDSRPAATGLPVVAAAPAASSEPRRADNYFDRLSAYAPLYVVYGPGTNTDVRIQLSFKYQLFGEAGVTGEDAPALNGLHFAFTQRLFSDIGRESTPFRNVDYIPELFYLLQPTSLGRGATIGGQFGIRHESNGREGLASRSFNTLYVQPVATVPVGDLSLRVGPRLWVYVGSKEENPDIAHYRGYTGLVLSGGDPQGLWFNSESRLNPGSGKGAIDLEVSYPVDRLLPTRLNLYLFGQAFTGYGENLLDYNRRMSRVRVGIGIVR